MGTWGTSLYSSDSTCDVRDDYKDMLRRGRTNEEITQAMFEHAQAIIGDPDEESMFWFALADTQWNYGRLTPEVKEKALYFLSREDDLNLWKETGDEKQLNAWIKTRETLRKKLLSPQPPEKKVYKYRLYHCPWKIGDVYAYQFRGEEARGTEFFEKYIYFVKAREDTCYPGHTVPVGYFFKTVTDTIIDLEELKDVEYIHQFFTKIAYEKTPTRKQLYLYAMPNTSARVIPKDQLTYIGNIGEVRQIENEDLSPYTILWKWFEKYMINNFRNWL